MTYGEFVGQKFEKRGFRKGHLEGRKESKGKIARDLLLKLNLDMHTVQKATKLPIYKLRKILEENKRS